MEKPLTVGVWVTITLYAVIGLFGVFVFGDALPNTQLLTDGYGVNDQTAVTLQARNAAGPVVTVSARRLATVPGTITAHADYVR
jgi:hypothetical protein